MDDMLDCERAGPLVARQADGALAPEERRALEAHLAVCPGCRDAIETQRLVRSVLAERPLLEPSPALSARIAADIAAEFSWLGVADWRRWTLRLAPLAAGLIIAALAWSQGSATPSAPAGAPNLTPIVETWLMGDRTEGLPATAVFLESDVSPETLILTVLQSAPDDALETGRQDPTK
jgi:predicted anti-sigma-YlaC factor YlaD